MIYFLIWVTDPLIRQEGEWPQEKAVLLQERDDVFIFHFWFHLFPFFFEHCLVKHFKKCVTMYKNR